MPSLEFDKATGNAASRWGVSGIRSDGILPYAGWTLGFTIAAVSVFRTIVNHDVSWLLYVADRVLNGDRLYVDVIEVNPPLVVILKLPVAWFAREFDFAAADLFRALAITWVGLAAVLSWVGSRVFGPDSRGQASFFVLCAAALLLLLPGYDFAQREHLFAIGFLPYLILSAGRLVEARPPRWLVITVGTTAAMGILLKPHFALAWVAVELSLAIWARKPIWYRGEAIVVVAAGVAYAAALVALFPAYLELAALSAPVYGDFQGVSRLTLLWEPRVALAFGAVLTWSLMCRPGGWRNLGRLMLAPLAMLIAAVLIQGKGWAYHWLPVEVMTALLVFATVSSRITSAHERLGSSGIPHGRIMAVSVVLLLVVSSARFAASDRLSRGQSPHSHSLGPVVAALPAGTPITAFSHAVRVAFPLATLHDVVWGSRFNSLWLLPGVVENPTEEAARVRNYLFGALVEDFETRRPRLLIVDQQPFPGAPPGFEYVGYFSADPRMAEILARYRLLDVVGNFHILIKDPMVPLSQRSAYGS